MRTVIIVGAGAALLAIGVAVTGGCLKSTDFRCSADIECTNAGFQGRCETDVGYCSFVDKDCESGYRYGETTSSQSGQCVGEQPTIDARIIDAPPDVYMADARECYGAGAYQLCFQSMPPTGTVSLTGALDTTADSRCVSMPASWTSAGQPDSCLVVAKDVTVSGTLVVTGTRPLVIVGDTISIVGTIDIASHRGGTTAAGAGSGQCAFVATPVVDAAGAGGGAGGSFMTIGGNGGRGATVAATGGTAGAATTPDPVLLRGGCAGQTGATGTQAAGAPGAGGGAIYIAAGTLTMSGTGLINASGGGGAGGGNFSGGSGGGAGGMIVIHAAQLGSTTGGKLVANGGGGASGGDNNTNGNNGSDPGTATITTPGAGGNMGNAGAAGGAGYAGGTAAVVGGMAGTGSQDGGGGGGGGGGYIQINVALPGVTSSPAATVVP